jgi:hypothetical protein
LYSGLESNLSHFGKARLGHRDTLKPACGREEKLEGVCNPDAARLLRERGECTTGSQLDCSESECNANAAEWHLANVAHEAAALSAEARSDSGFLGTMREDAELLDAIVEDAMRRRMLQAWCPSPKALAALEALSEETGRSLNELLDAAMHLLLQRRGRL